MILKTIVENFDEIFWDDLSRFFEHLVRNYQINNNSEIKNLGKVVNRITFVNW